MVGWVVTVISTLSSALAIYYIPHSIERERNENIVYTFATGLDGAGPPNETLNGAMGNLPRALPFNEHGEHICCRKKPIKCKSGSICRMPLKDVRHLFQQPTYTLFKATKDDPICLSWITVEFPERTVYGWIGNWGQTCGAPWYYSDIYVQNDHGADKVSCTWLDAKGIHGLTGLQVHWPEFQKGFEGNGNDPQYYCNTPPALNFFTEDNPRNIYYWESKQNMSSEHPAEIYKTGYIQEKGHRCLRRDHDDVKQPHNITRHREVVNQNDTKQSDGPDAEKRASGPIPPKPRLLPRMMVNERRLVKSRALSHRATELCESPFSVGPSFVSYRERKFCHMADKRLYSFCDDTRHGECWDDEKHEIIHKSASGVVRRAANPAVAFTNTLHWG